MNALRSFTALFLVTGVLLTGRAVYLHAKAELAGFLIRRAWEESVQSGNLHVPWSWADTHPIARLRIPRLGYDEIVLEGATPRTLAFGPARLFSGADMGQQGNLILAGHRTSWFRPLEKIRQGDQIELEWMNAHHSGTHKRTYTVDLIRITNPQDVSLLAPTSEDALTLITCYPFGPGPTSPQRFIVRATPVETGNLAADERVINAERSKPQH
ncbi:MAG: class GN sortase [Candidatus Angelobacter sp. Gp1-AA117]|nr:MAG: class GN sortase [Candidatus Angelobacter sp. Gp1-AA117]